MKILAFLLCFNLFLFAEEDEEKLCRQLEADRRAYAEYIEYVNEVRSTVARQVQEELNLHCCGTMGMMHGKIEDIGMDFVAYRRATVKEARALTLLALDKLVKAVNAHEKIQPFLEVTPFTHERAQVFISFVSSEFGPFKDGTVLWARNVTGNANAEEKRNKLLYSADNPFKEPIVDLLVESYEEAVALNELNPVAHPEIHQEIDKEKFLDQFFDDFGNDVGREFHLYCNGLGGELVNDIEIIGGHFTLLQPVDQDEARQLIVSVTEKFLKALNEHKGLKPYLKEHPFPSSRVKMLISFRTRKDWYFYETSIKDVILKNNIITYDKAVKNEYNLTGIVHFDPEIYSEALEKVKNAPVSVSKLNYWMSWLASFFPRNFGF